MSSKSKFKKGDLIISIETKDYNDIWVWKVIRTEKGYYILASTDYPEFEDLKTEVDPYFRRMSPAEIVLYAAQI